MPVESIKRKRLRMAEILSILKLEYPDSKCSLDYNSPFQLLVATVLSAQCTDERVNKVVIPLFDKYPTPEDFTQLTVAEIGKEIYSTGFYNNKAKSIKGLSHSLVDEYDGEVPGTMNELVNLTGVGRKTANVVLGNIFDVPGVVVDTHVTRITNLLNFTKSKNAVVIERELEKIIDKTDWTLFTHLIIDHGRAICVANRPNCSECSIAKFCPSST
ncbi:MAG: endonuclease III [Candidatus Marinimicrobia bacterium]|nr:endonuclease III [Candidatus Neomarinimicrobiota bacterium]